MSIVPFVTSLRWGRNLSNVGCEAGTEVGDVDDLMPRGTHHQEPSEAETAAAAAAAAASFERRKIGAPAATPPPASRHAIASSRTRD